MLCARFRPRRHKKHGMGPTDFRGRVQWGNCSGLRQRDARVLTRQQRISAWTIRTAGSRLHVRPRQPRGFPQQDRAHRGFYPGDHRQLFRRDVPPRDGASRIVAQDPAIDTSEFLHGRGNGTSTGTHLAQLKNPSIRKRNADQVIARCARRTDGIPGRIFFFQ